MLYSNLQFPAIANRPFVYANFVTTLDGKIDVLPHDNRYWPIGTPEDCDTLVGLRAYADVLIHGKNTAISHKTINSLAKADFQQRRQVLNKTKDILYLVASNHPNLDLVEYMEAKPQVPTMLGVTNSSQVPEELAKVTQVEKFGDTEINLGNMLEKLYYLGYKNVLLEGGPTLFRSFLAENLVDELFITVAPKLFGTAPQQTLSLVEGGLFGPEEVKNLGLLSVKQHESELYLRYKIAAN